MKTFHRFFTITIVTIILHLGLQTKSFSQTPNGGNYAIAVIVNVQDYLYINIYYGTDKKEESIVLENKNAKNWPYPEFFILKQNTIVNTLNKLSKDGYKVVSENVQTSAGSSVGSTYTLYKE